MSWFEIILAALQSQGYAGMFLIGIVGNMIPFIPVPFLIPVFLVSTVLDPLPLGIAVGIGSAIGKCVSYAIGRGGAKILGEKKQKELSVFSRLLGRYGVVAVLLFATLPLPDDIIVIPFGMMKYASKSSSQHPCRRSLACSSLQAGIRSISKRYYSEAECCICIAASIIMVSR